MSNHYEVISFIDGQRDCRDGKDAEPKSFHDKESYLAGYGAQYQLDEINSNQGDKNEHFTLQD